MAQSAQPIFGGLENAGSANSRRYQTEHRVLYQYSLQANRHAISKAPKVSRPVSASHARDQHPQIAIWADSQRKSASPCRQPRPAPTRAPAVARFRPIAPPSYGADHQGPERGAWHFGHRSGSNGDFQNAQQDGPLCAYPKFFGPSLIPCVNPKLKMARRWRSPGHFFDRFRLKARLDQFKFLRHAVAHRRIKRHLRQRCARHRINIACFQIIQRYVFHRHIIGVGIAKVGQQPFG